MHDYKRTRLTDFYFNGQYLSDFGGEIGGTDILTNVSILPDREVTMDSAIGVDEKLVLNVDYNPRTFSVPVYFDNLAKIREIAGWLGVKKPKDFYFKGDDVKIKCMIDGGLSVDRVLHGGMGELKFIAHDMYYYAVSDTKHIFRNPANKTSAFVNRGNKCSYPEIRVVGSGDVTLKINSHTIRLEQMTEPLNIDIKHRKCLNDKGENMFRKREGDYPTLNCGKNEITVIGNCSEISIKCNSRWV